MNNVLKITKNKTKQITLFLLIIILSNTVTGCKLTEEKTYTYYISHPTELIQDYEHCKVHPGSTVCFDILRKYNNYQKMSGFTPTQTTAGYIFRHLDEPIDSLGANPIVDNRG